MRVVLPLVVAIGCGSPGTVPEPVDLTLPLGPGQVRAGEVTDDAALIGGLAAEGRAGDFKIYNDRAVFVIQGLREGDYYVQEGGGVVDADVVRPDGQPGRDVVDEWGTQLGFGRLLAPEQIEVVSDGTRGGPAIVRVTGTDTGLGLLEGALEAPGFVARLGLGIVQDYVLYPDTWLLQVHTTVTAGPTAVSFKPGDVMMSGPEAADTWAENTGMGELGTGTRRFAGYVGKRNDIAVGVVAWPGTVHDAAGGDLLTSLAFMVLGFGPEVTIEPGGSMTWSRYYAVAPDMATLSDAALAARGEASDTASGVVTAPDGPVAGARVVVSVDGAPFTVAFTGGDGSFSAQVPAGAAHTELAVGRSDGKILDLPEGAAPYGPYASGPARQVALDALVGGAEPVPFAAGRGIGTAASPLTLGQPGSLEVHVADGLPFSVRVDFVGGDPVGPVDEAIVHDRPSGHAAAGWSRDGDVTLPVEPGTYDVLVHRGLRWEVHQEQVTITAGQTARVDADLGPPLDHGGWLLGDPHAHASPSGDGEITMEGRLLVHSGAGYQVHFGTDHDHVADYRPLIETLGLSSAMTSIVSDEFSPVLRGHINVYPVTPDPTRGNNGAVSWWGALLDDTASWFAALRERHGPDVILQSNHPLDSGMPGFAGWSPGVIDDPDRWSPDFQSIEVNNAGSLEGVDPYLDFVARGMRVAAVGVTDSHHHFGGDPGINGTWLALGDDPSAVTDAALIEAIRGEHTMATRGLFLDLSIEPGGTVEGEVDLHVEVRSSSWIRADRVLLLRDGVEVERVDGTVADFALTHTEDAVYTVVAEGDTPMTPVSGRTPWAMSSAIRYDATGDGWTPGLPALELGP